MKKTAFFLILLFGIFSLIKSQTVDSIKIEQAGDLIKIHYKILNSTPDQVFRVNVFCSINGGLPSVLKSLSGDFGDNVVGGRSDYMVLWDVLKDVDEVKSVDFSVRAELIKDNSLSGSSDSKAISKRRFHVLVVGEFPGLKTPEKFGVKIGYIGSWGISAMYLSGNSQNVYSSFYAEGKAYTGGLDLTKRIVNAKKFKMHLYTGVLVSKFQTENPNDHSFLGYKSLSGMEGGLILSFPNLLFSFGYGSFKKERQDIKISSRNEFIYLGLGYRF
jgi:hypothetical protein